jgi:hypothetical protein
VAKIAHNFSGCRSLESFCETGILLVQTWDTPLELGINYQLILQHSSGQLLSSAESGPTEKKTDLVHEIIGFKGFRNNPKDS